MEKLKGLPKMVVANGGLLVLIFSAGQGLRKSCNGNRAKGKQGKSSFLNQMQKVKHATIGGHF
jgi:hypothetical protein